MDFYHERCLALFSLGQNKLDVSRTHKICVMSTYRTLLEPNKIKIKCQEQNVPPINKGISKLPNQWVQIFYLFLINPRLRLFKNKNLKHLDDALDVLLDLLVFLLHQPGQDDQPVTLDRNFVVLRKKEKKKLIKDVRPRKIFYRGRLCWSQFSIC